MPAKPNELVSTAISNAKEEINSIREELATYHAAIEQYTEDDPYVLGELIAKASALETELRHRIAFVTKRYGYDKQRFRNMIFGYYQVEKDGNVLKYDDDSSPEFITIPTSSGAVKICKNDIPAIKEIILNHEIPMDDDFSTKYALKSGEIADGELMEDIASSVVKLSMQPHTSPIVVGKCCPEKAQET